MSQIEIGKAGMDEWKKLSESEKAEWQECAAADRQRYEREMAKFKG